MFRVGQMIYHKTRKDSGKVVAIEGDTVYFEQSNGVEVDFPAAMLTASPPAGTSALAASAAAPVRVLTAADITPEHQRVLAVIPPRTLQAVAALWERTNRTQRFSTLDVARKLNFIADVTAVPYRVMREYRDRPGELGLMMARGLSISAGGGG